jgi:hypothetical protein
MFPLLMPGMCVVALSTGSVVRKPRARGKTDTTPSNNPKRILGKLLSKQTTFGWDLKYDLKVLSLLIAADDLFVKKIR